MKLLEYIIEKKVFIALMVILITFLGSYAFLNLDRELTPAVNLNGVTIDVNAEDINVAEVESKITKLLEQKLKDVDGVKKIESTSYLGGSSIHVSFERGYDKDLVRELESVAHSFGNKTSEIKDVNVAQNGSDTEYGFILDISGSDMSAISEFALNELKPRMEQLPEISDVKLSGMENNYVDIAFKKDKLQENKVKVAGVIDIIERINEESTLGNLSDEDGKPALRWDTKLENVNDIKDIEIPVESGVILLDEIAQISVKERNNHSNVWKDGKKDFVLVEIGGTSNTTQIELAEAVRNELDKIHDDDLDKGLSINEIVAHGDFVDDSMNSVTKNIAIGGVIAILVLLLFLRSIRATVIIGVSIPTSILLTIISIWGAGYSLNMLTLVGLGLAIGMMVDSSIVILESIYSKKKQGLSSNDAVVQGTGEVSSAIIASVLTTIVVFLPIGLIGGDAGKFMIILSVVVAVTLISSVVVAFTLIPALAEKFMKIRKKNEDQKEKGTLRVYNKMMAWIIAKKVRSLTIIILFLVLFGSSLLLIPKIPMSTMPDVFDRYTENIVELENGTTNDEKQEIAKSINEKLEPIEDVKASYLIDQGNKFISVIKMTTGNGIHNDQKKVTDTVLKEMRELQEDNPIRSVHSALSGSGGYPVQINLRGEDFDKLQSISKNVVDKIETIDGIVGITNSMDETSDVQKILLDTDELEKNDITKLEMKDWIDQALLGTTIGEMDAEHGKKIPMNVSWDGFKETEEALLDLQVPTIDDKNFSSFIQLQKENVPKKIYHLDGERYISIFADIEDRDLGAVNRDIQNVIEEVKLDSGYSVSLGGELEGQEDLVKDITFVFAISIFLVYLVMAVQFNHFGQPLMVMSTIPVTVTGVILGMFITQMELNIMSGMGLIMLVGIVLNNAILLIDRTNQLQTAGTSLIDAIINAGQDRIRPIFMTTLTTVGGMIPLAMASGMSADYQAPLATVIISGLLFSTLITLVLIPCIYRLFSKV